MLSEHNLVRILYTVKLLIKNKGETDIFRQTKAVYHLEIVFEKAPEGYTPEKRKMVLGSKCAMQVMLNKQDGGC